jgi:hypothetical protein
MLGSHPITDKAQWGEHIALTCKNHPALRWSTKNIAPLGSRSIFYLSWEIAPECSCKADDLIPVLDFEQ